MFLCVEIPDGRDKNFGMEASYNINVLFLPDRSVKNINEIRIAMAPRTEEQYKLIRREKRELIKETALRIFSQKGYQATTISEITKAANISKGLLYNYFESKESLLTEILTGFVKTIGSLLPLNDEKELTGEGLEHYFDSLVDSMKKDREYWMVYIQLSVQTEVVSHIFSSNGVAAYAEKYMQTIYTYFDDRFENPQEMLLLFRSVVKGLSMILVYTPEACPDAVVNALKNRLKSMFVKNNTG